MSVVFLDFDGVLVSLRCIRNRTSSGFAGGDPEAVAALNWLTDTTDARIVISSTWRHMGITKCRQALREWGVKGKVIGCTERDSEYRTDSDIKTYIERGRGDQVQSWLNLHPDAERFVCLDDDDHFGHLRGFLVQTTFEQGLTMADAARAARLLMR